MDKKTEAVIFDWAGTTVDYGCFAPVQAFTEVFKEFGIEPTIEEVRKPMGMLKIDHIRTMLSMERKIWETLEVTSVEHVIKVGDTISDIKEGKNAGVLSVAVLEGSSEMGLSQKEYEALSEEEKQDLCEKTKQNFLEAGADYVIRDMSDLLGIVSL